MKKVEFKLNEKDVLKYIECGIKAILERNQAKRKDIFEDMIHALGAGSEKQLLKSFSELKKADKEVTEDLENLSPLLEIMEIVEPLSSDT